jgi:hypothetical protein
MKLSAFAEKHDLTMEIHERPRQIMESLPGSLSKRFYAHFKRAEVRQGEGGLLGLSGDGPTPSASVADYCRQLEGRLLIVNAFSGDERREIQVPNDLKCDWSDP